VVTDERCNRALQYLAKTDEDCAVLKTEVLRKEYVLDLAKKRVFLISDGNIEERKATAEVSGDVQGAIEAHLKATLAFEKVRAKRATEAMIVDTWRSVNANRRSGNV